MSKLAFSSPARTTGGNPICGKPGLRQERFGAQCIQCRPNAALRVKLSIPSAVSQSIFLRDRQREREREGERVSVSNLKALTLNNDLNKDTKSGIQIIHSYYFVKQYSMSKKTFKDAGVYNT